MAVMRALRPRNTYCLAWGRGGGKSWFQRTCWWTSIAEWDGRYRPGASDPGARWVLLMPTLEQAKKVHAAGMIAELEGEWAWLGGKINRSEWRVTFPGGSWVQWVTGERARNIRGIRCDGLSADECDDIPIDLYDAIVTPWFSEPHSLGIQILSGTPTRSRYGLLWRTLMRGKGKLLDENGNQFAGHFASHHTAYDFPEHVSPEMLERARLEMPPELFAREWLCSFDAGEGLVYPHFSEDFHVRYPHPETVWNEHIIGVDWGWEDPTVFSILGIGGHGRDVQMHQLAEVVVRHKTDSELVEIARQVDAQYPNARWYADPSSPQRIEAFRKRVDIGPDGHNRGGAGVRIEGSVKHEIVDGVATVADVLLARERPEPIGRWAQLFIHPDCVETIREFGMYRRKRNPRNRDEVLDELEDKNNHCMDAIRYAIQSRFGGEDRRIVTGYGVR
jgi:Terminase RNAseH like domain